MFLPQRLFYFFFHKRVFPFLLIKTALPTFLEYGTNSSSHRYIWPVNDSLPQQVVKAFLPLLPRILGWLKLCGSQADLTAGCFSLYPTHILTLCSTVQQPGACHTTHQTISVLTQEKTHSFPPCLPGSVSCSLSMWNGSVGNLKYRSWLRRMERNMGGENKSDYESQHSELLRMLQNRSTSPNTHLSLQSVSIIIESFTV